MTEPSISIDREGVVTIALRDLWSRPVSVNELANSYRVHRNTLGERIADGSIVVRTFGGLVRVRLDTAPAALVAESCTRLHVLDERSETDGTGST